MWWTGGAVLRMESAGGYGTGGVARRCWNSHGVDQTTIKRRCKPALPVMEMEGSGAATVLVISGSGQ